MGGKRVSIPIPNNGLDYSQNPGVIDISCISACDGWIGYKDLIRKDWELIRVRQSTGPAGLREIGEIPGCDSDVPEYHINPSGDGIKDGLFPGWDNMSNWEDDGSDSFWCVNYPYNGKFKGGGAAGCNPTNVRLTGQSVDGENIKILEDGTDYENLSYTYSTETGVLDVGFTVINADINELAIDVTEECPQEEGKEFVDVTDPDGDTEDDNFIDDGTGMDYGS